MLKVCNRNTRKMFELCSNLKYVNMFKLTVKTPEQRHWRVPLVFLLPFWKICHIFFQCFYCWFCTGKYLLLGRSRYPVDIQPKSNCFNVHNVVCTLGLDRVSNNHPVGGEGIELFVLIGLTILFSEKRDLFWQTYWLKRPKNLQA